MNTASVSLENFLKTIYHLEHDEQEQATSSQLADRLKITRAAVSDMSKSLSAKGLVEYTPYQPLKLSQSGLKVALKLIRRHRIWETFLHEVLDMDWDEVHDEAEKLEHQTSEKLLERMNAYLGFPDYDPHGDPIPTKEGIFPISQNQQALTKLNAGHRFKLMRLINPANQLIEFYKVTGLKPGMTCNLDKIMSDDSLIITSEDKQIVLPQHIAKNLIVEIIN